MFYTIYKITNKLNNKYYIGMHKTNNLNDDYMGSGKLIRRAIKKYGVENFHKETLHVFDNEIDMHNKEKELVVLNEMSYNLCDGGKGGFGYLNKQSEKKDWVRKGRVTTNRILSKRQSEESRQRHLSKNKKCVCCDSVLSYEKRFNKFCNHSCSAKYNNMNRVCSSKVG